MSALKAGGSEERYTPKYIFDKLGCRFDMDVAAPVDRTHVYTPTDVFITEDSLSKQWEGFVWMNPPYGHNRNKRKWMNKLAEHGSGIALMPDRTSAPWYQEAVKKATAVLLVDGKIKFTNPDGTKDNQPANGSTLFAYGAQGVAALLIGEMHGLGVVLKRP